jgi:hypothetical protein
VKHASRRTEDPAFIEYIREHFYYNDDDGRLYIKKKISNQQPKVGCVAGFLGNHGRYSLGINGEGFLASRIIWCLHHGVLAHDMLVDHEDGNTQNDRIGNLRLLSNKHNALNTKRLRNNSSGHVGVRKLTSKKTGLVRYAATITVDGLTYASRRTTTFEDALALRVELEQKYAPGLNKRSC